MRSTLSSYMFRQYNNVLFAGLQENTTMSSGSQGFHWVDYLVFSAVLAISLGIGLYHAFTGGKQKTTQEFLMANRQLRTVPVALSILVSFVSAILVLGTPAEMYTRGTLLTTRVIGYCLTCVISSLLFVPLFFPLKIRSTFEYLDRRFQSRLVRLMGTISMLLGNTFYMGLVMYSPSTALQAVTGFPLVASVTLTGVVAAIYTSLGGMKAVIYTDVFQSVIMLGGLLAIVIQGTIKVGGLAKVWNVSAQGGRLRWVNFDPDPTQRLTTWSLVIGGMFSSLGIFGIGQTSVQRYCSVPTMRQAKASVFLNIPGLIIVNVLATLAGLVIYAYYTEIGCDPLKGPIKNANQLVPYFIQDVLKYPGVIGLFIAVLYSGALSSLSSSLNAATTVTWEDILKPFLKHKPELWKTALTKFLVAVYGIIAVAVAFASEFIGGHVLSASLSFTGATSGPSLGMFLLGSFFRSANSKGAVVGFIFGISLNLWIALGAFTHRPHALSLPTANRSCVVQPTVDPTSFLSFSPESFVTYSILDSFTSSSTSAPQTPSGLLRLYSVSFLWYSAIGAGVTIVIGLIVSACTGGMHEDDLDDELIIPLTERLCCCLPKRLRKKISRTYVYELKPTHSMENINQAKAHDHCDNDENIDKKRNNQLSDT